MLLPPPSLLAHVGLPSAAEIVRRSQGAYDAVRTFEQDSVGTINGSKATAHVLFSRPGRLRVSGATLFGSKYDLLCDGKSAWVKNPDAWTPVQSSEMGIATVTGITANAATLVPATLLHTAWGRIGQRGAGKPTVDRVTVGGRSLLRVKTAAPYVSATLFDAKTYFVVKTETTVLNRSMVVTFAPPKVNGAIPASRFRK